LAAIVAFLVYRAARTIDPQYWNQNQSDTLARLTEHIQITVYTLAISVAIALPIGTLVARIRWLYTPIMAVLGGIYTIPSLALLAWLVTYAGIGLEPAVIALVAYAQFILVRNVAVGLRSVDPNVIDSARGMGMNWRQILFKVEYPLALPVMLAGLRIATVATIAIATIAAKIGAGGLGTLLFDGVTNGYTSEIQVGAIAVSSLAIAADILLRLLDRVLPASKARATR